MLHELPGEGSYRFRACPRAHSACGFVLMEAIVAIGVLLMLVGAVLGLTTRSSTGTRTATDRIIATYLAQDMAETIIARRAHNIATTNIRWYAGIGYNLPAGTHFSISTTSSISNAILATCTLDAALQNCRLYYNANLHQYTYSAGGGTVTPYTRYVQVSKVTDLDDDPDGSDEVDAIRYTIVVTWKSGEYVESLPLSITLYEP